MCEMVLVQGGLGGVPIGGLTRRLHVVDKLPPVPPSCLIKPSPTALHVADKLPPVSPHRVIAREMYCLHVADKLPPVSPADIAEGEDTDPAGNTVTASTNAVVGGLILRAVHADNAPITEWEITTQTVASAMVDLFEFSEPQGDGFTRTLSIKADANLAP